MRPRALFPIGLAALTVLAYAAQGILLKRTPKVGDKATYKMTGKLSVTGTDVDVIGTMSDEVTKIESGAFTTKSVTKMTINLMGNEQPLPESSSVTVTNLDGTVVSLKQGDATPDSTALRLAHLNALYLPQKSVAMNESWVLEGKKDEKIDAPAFKITYKLVGDEKVGKYDTYRITADGGETEGDTPTKIKADYWIEKSTGNLIKQKSELTNAVYSASFPPVNGTMDVIRQD